MLLPYQKFGGGLVERDDPRELEPGDLTSAIGAEYRPGTSKVYTTGYRKNAGSMGSAEHVNGFIYAQYDTSNQTRLVTGSGTTIYEVAPATSAMSGAVATLDSATLAYASTPTQLVGKMDRETLIVASGVAITTTIDGTSVTRGQNLVRRNDGTHVLLGMLAPQEIPSPVAATVTANRQSPNSNTGSWTNPANAQDTDDDTKAHVTRSSAGSTVHTWKFGAFTAASHKIKVLHGTSGQTGFSIVGAGGHGAVAYGATLKIEYTINGNAGSPTFTQISNKRVPYEDTWTEVPIADASYSSNDVQVRCTNVYSSGSLPASTYAHTIKAEAGATTAPDGTLGFRYVATEREINSTSNALVGESAPSKESTLVTLTAGQNAVQVTLPAARQNNRTTHWGIYRQPNGAVAGEFDKYGLIAEVPALNTAGTFIASQVYVDTFTKPLTEVASPTLDVLTVGTGDDVTFFMNNDAPPLYSSIDIYKGSLVGVPVDDPDSVYFSPPFEIEHRPVLYAIPSRSSRNDKPIAVKTVSDTLLIFFPDWTRAIRGLPLVINGLFDPAEYTDASLTRGACGPLAFDDITLSKEDGTRWIFVMDREGAYITNGTQFEPWSSDIKWENHVNYAAITKTIAVNDPIKRRVRVYYAEGAATNITRALDFYYGDMRADGQPKASGPHYSVARGEARAVISGAIQRFTTATFTGAQGTVFWEDPSAYYSDDSKAYNSSAHVPRVLTTGDLPCTTLGDVGFVKRVALKTVRGAYATIAQTVSLKMGYGETRTLAATEDPAAPTPMGVACAGETLTYSMDDTGVLEKAEVLGLHIDSHPMAGDGAAMLSALGAAAGSTSIPTT